MSTVAAGGRRSRVVRGGPVPGAALGAATIAFSGILVRAAGVSPSTAAVMRCAYAVPFLLVVAAWQGAGPRPWGERRLAFAAGALLGVELVVWHRSIAEVGAGLATVLANLQVVFVALIAWVALGERVARRTGVAIAVVLAGAALISGVLEEGAYGRDPPLGAFFGLLAGATYGGFIVLFRQTGRGGALAGPLVDVSVAGALTAAALGAALGELDLVPGWPAQGWLVLLALDAQVLGFLLIGAALPRLPAALGAMLLMLQPVAAIGLAAALLGESPSALQLAGVAVLLGGVLLASAGGHPPARRYEPAGRSG